MIWLGHIGPWLSVRSAGTWCLQPCLCSVLSRARKSKQQHPYSPSLPNPTFLLLFLLARSREGTWSALLLRSTRGCCSACLRAAELGLSISKILLEVGKGGAAPPERYGGDCIKVLIHPWRKAC